MPELRTRSVRRRLWTALAAGVGLGAACLVSRPDRALRTATGFVSHTLCSTRFVSGLDPAQVYAETIRPMPGFAAFAWALRYDVDASRREVRASVAGGFPSHAVYREGRGCTIVRDGEPPPAIQSEPASAPPVPPLAGPAPVEAADRRLAEAVARAFDEPEGSPRRRTKAVVVVQDGRVAAERYAPGYGVETPLLGWSLTKSVTSALVGILVREGRLSVGQPAPVPAWRDPADPRRAVTIDHLLRMTSGLALDETHSGFDPASQMLHVEPDMARFAAGARLREKPGTVWRYTSGNTLILSGILRDAVGGRAEDVRRFARRELFGPLGMRSATFEFDAAGAPIGSTYLFATARDWARFGMLYLDDGIVNGQRVLPEGWVRYCSSPTLGGPYAAGFWLGSTRWRAHWQAPADAFFAAGMLGQRVLVVPSERLVIVRFGVTHEGDEGLGRLLQDVLAARRHPSRESGAGG